jgi:hypothetical protein
LEVCRACGQTPAAMMLRTAQFPSCDAGHARALVGDPRNRHQLTIDDIEAAAPRHRPEMVSRFVASITDDLDPHVDPLTGRLML